MFVEFRKSDETACLVSTSRHTSGTLFEHAMWLTQEHRPTHSGCRNAERNVVAADADVVKFSSSGLRFTAEML